MNFIRNHLPLNPLEARKFHCPSTALNLDAEIAGVFWVYFCCRTIAQLFPGGIQIEVHVYIETDNAHEEAAPEAGEQLGANGEDGDEENDVMMALLDERAVEDLM